MDKVIATFLISIFTLLCSAQVCHPTAWLRADSATLGFPTWTDVSGNALDATPTSGTMPAAFSRINFNKSFEVGGAETFTLPLGINDSRQSDVIVVYETYDTVNENALWQMQLDTAKRIGQTTRRILNDNGQITYHPDHLGSRSWITTTNGSSVQHLHYLPWGETYVDQKSNRFDGVRYTFSAKEKDSETGLSYFGARYYTSDLSIWLSVDPMSDKYPSLSPYVYCANNPIKLVDPNGESISEFDENGNYLRTIKDNWFHNTFYGRKGHIVDDDGNMMHEFSFGDPEHDVQDLKDGKITKVIFVQEKEIKQMLENSGVFDSKNTAENSGRYDYVLKEGKGKKELDFSYTKIPYQYPEASKNPLITPSSILFLVDDVAYNHMNFGNFLFGAAGYTLGLSLFELKIGAHYNSIFNSRTNGYSPQFDSPDDQTAIKNGVNYAKQHGY